MSQQAFSPTRCVDTDVAGIAGLWVQIHPVAVGFRPLWVMFIGSFVFPWQQPLNGPLVELLWTLSKRERTTHCTKEEKKKRQFYCLDFCFVLYINLLQTKRGYKNEETSVYILLPVPLLLLLLHHHDHHHRNGPYLNMEML